MHFKFHHHLNAEKQGHSRVKLMIPRTQNAIEFHIPRQFRRVAKLVSARLNKCDMRYLHVSLGDVGLCVFRIVSESPLLVREQGGVVKRCKEEELNKMLTIN